MGLTEISDKVFKALRDVMYDATGVRLPPTKKALVVARLRKRLEELGLDCFADYLARLKSAQSTELEVFINAITTNETYFFRHEQQFEYLTREILPALIEKKKKANKREIKIWSAACSTGEEPYSLAISCAEFARTHPRWTFHLYATDINSIVLQSCKEGVYGERSLSKVSETLKKKYFTMISAESQYKRPQFQLNKNIIQMVKFSRHNLLKSFMHGGMDIIFLRNVMIYFDKEVKQTVVNHVVKSLTPEGYFFISLSESLFDIKSNLKLLKSGIFIKE